MCATIVSFPTSTFLTKLKLNLLLCLVFFAGRTGGHHRVLESVGRYRYRGRNRNRVVRVNEGGCGSMLGGTDGE